MNINWKVRLKNPYFWCALGGVVLAAMGVNPEMFTSWDTVLVQLKELISNPYMLVSVILAVIGIINDPTTAGITNSRQALEYQKPKKE